MYRSLTSGFIAAFVLLFSSLSYSVDDFSAYIVNGTNVASASDYPSYVRLVLWIDYPSNPSRDFGPYENGGDTGYCGGVILDDYHILTAAHCVYIESETNETYALFTYVYPQLMQESQSVLESSSTPKIRVSEIYIPDSYNDDKLYYDIAILKLEESLAGYSLETSYEATLPEFGDGSTSSAGYRYSSQADNQFTAVGHGNTASNVDSTDRLQYANLTYVPNNSCNYSGDLTHNLCMEGDVTFGLESATCQGDSGGPLYWEDGSSIQKLVGITSFGPSTECGDDTINAATSVFSEVIDFKSWISDVVSGSESARYAFTESDRESYRNGTYTFQYTSDSSSSSSSGSSGGSIPLWTLAFLTGGLLLRRKRN